MGGKSSLSPLHLKKSFANHDECTDGGGISDKQMQTNDDNKRTNVQVILLTFPNLYPYHNNQKDSSTNHLKKLHNWKYYVLGDGGVYFDQRPYTLQALNRLLLNEITIFMKNKNEMINDDDGVAIPPGPFDLECAVISTCQRFEILMTIENTSQSKYTLNEIDLKSIAAITLAKQISSQSRRLSVFGIIPLALPLDRPSRIKFLNRSNQKLDNKRFDDIKENIENEIVIINGKQDVATRLITLACGLLDREVFRPFSSRDAHIMAQIKRTLVGSQRLHSSIDIVDGVIDKNPKYVKVLFDAALQGGKAARSPKVVPILNELKDQSQGADGPQELSEKSAKQAKELAVIPTAQTCVGRMTAMESSVLIKSLRNDVMKKANEYGIDVAKNEGKQIRQILHDPIVELRRGNDVDMEEIFYKIDESLHKK